MTNEQLPHGARRIAEQYPDVWRAYELLGKSCAEAGPLDSQTLRLIKLAVAGAVGSEGAVHSHVRRALAEGIAPESLRQVGLLLIATAGFPKAAATLTWIEDIVSGDRT
ncbi:MAG: carboxymuconolactone decarboxylase family protein [Sedimenticolaceae bacterium]